MGSQQHRTTQGYRLAAAAISVILAAQIQDLQNVHCQQIKNQTTATSIASNKIEPIEHLSRILSDKSVDGYGQTDNQQIASLSSYMLKSYIRINNMRAYHLDLHAYRPEAKYEGDPKFVDSTSSEHLARCSRHLSLYHESVRSFAELDPILDTNYLESMRLADSFGKPRSGVLMGNQFWLGSYDSCLDIRLSNEFNTSDSIKAHYCVGLVQFPNWNLRDTKNSIKVGLCLPETCTSSMLNENSKLFQETETMMKLSFGQSQPYDRLRLRSVYCLPHETSPARQYSSSAIGFITFIAAFLVITIIATIIDNSSKRVTEVNNTNDKPPRTSKTILLESFSLSRNIDKFLNVSRQQQTPQQNDSTDSLDRENSYDRRTFLDSTVGLKCLGLIWIIFAHCFLVSPIPESNLISLDKLTQTYLANIYLAAHLMVDTFFVLSGILASFFIFTEGIDTITTTNWVVLTIHRYWRLTPIYLILYWFSKSVSHLLNSGPLWDYMTAPQSPRLNCANESWWEAILHLSDFKSAKDHCVPFAWFIANGIKFWMITPFILIAIHKSIRRGYTIIGSAVVANMALVTYLAFKSSVDYKSIIEFRPEAADDILNNMGQVYSRPYSRVSTYLIGLLVGHIMYRIDSNQLQVRLSKNAKTIVWSLFAMTVIVLTFTLKIANGMQLDGSALKWTFGISSAIIRPLWAVCTCWLIFALANGELRWLSRILCANFFKILVKVSFSAYLVQGEVMAHIYLAKTDSEIFTYMDLISRPIVSTVMTILVSVCMTLLIEYPLVAIEELILPAKRNKNPSKSVALSKENNLKVRNNKLKST